MRWTAEQYEQFRADALEKKVSKYRNKPEQVDGILFASRKEARHYVGLCLLKKAGVIVGFEMQVRYPLTVREQRVGVYVADFVVTFPDGRTEVQDVKGVRTPVYKLKKRLMKAVYEIEINEI